MGLNHPHPSFPPCSGTWLVLMVSSDSSASIQSLDAFSMSRGGGNLHHAASQGDVALVRQLLTAGCKVCTTIVPIEQYPS